jgi:hypothetical protein
MYKPAWRQSAQNARSSEGAAEATQTSALGERERERERVCVCVCARANVSTLGDLIQNGTGDHTT